MAKLLWKIVLLDWIERSKKALFELCPSSTERFVSHKGPQNNVNNIKSCLKLLNEAGENIPRVMSHYLDEFQPVTFNSLDISCLLGKTEHFYHETGYVCADKCLQGSPCSNSG